jgi:hypothetical protein
MSVRRRRLEDLTPPGGVTVASNNVFHLPVPTAAVAEMFGLNLSVWRDDPWVEANHASLVRALPERLRTLESSTRTDEIAWDLRHMVLSQR